jgi:hypothetical protein
MSLLMEPDYMDILMMVYVNLNEETDFEEVSDVQEGVDY